MHKQRFIIIEEVVSNVIVIDNITAEREELRQEC